MNKQDQEITLKDILSLLLSKIKFIILITVLGMLAAFLYAELVLPVQYTSSVSIYVKNSSGDDANGASTLGDLNAAKSLAGTYIVILGDDVVYDQVSEMLLEDYEAEDLKKFFTVVEEDGETYIPAQQLKKAVSISSVNETEVIKIQATTRSPQLSADICTYIADIAPDILTRVTKAGSVESIGSAKIPKNPSSPNVRNITLIGGVIGLILSAVLVIIASLLDNRVSSADEIRQRYSIPVLAEIPDLEMDPKEASKYEY